MFVLVCSRDVSKASSPLGLEFMALTGHSAVHWPLSSCPHDYLVSTLLMLTHPLTPQMMFSNSFA